MAPMRSIKIRQNLIVQAKICTARNMIQLRHGRCAKDWQAGKRALQAEGKRHLNGINVMLLRDVQIGPDGVIQSGRRPRRAAHQLVS